MTNYLLVASVAFLLGGLMQRIADGTQTRPQAAFLIGVVVGVMCFVAGMSAGR